MKKLRWIYRKIHKETLFWSHACIFFHCKLLVTGAGSPLVLQLRSWCFPGHLTCPCAECGRPSGSWHGWSSGRWGAHLTKQTKGVEKQWRNAETEVYLSAYKLWQLCIDLSDLIWDATTSLAWRLSTLRSFFGLLRESLRAVCKANGRTRDLLLMKPFWAEAFVWCELSWSL